MTQPNLFTGRFKKEYEFLDKLSIGKYADVFKVKHLTDENEYAVKRIKIEQIDNLEKLRKEVTSLARIKHENIVAYNTSWLEEHGKTGIPRYLFIALELGDMTIQQWLRETENQEERDSLIIKSFWKQLACGLSYIHDRRIIHGNLKPSNILLFRNGSTVDEKTVLKIGNIGNVKQTYNMNDEKNPESRYLAPEMRSFSAAERQQKWGTTVDYYSLGLILIQVAYPMTDKKMNKVCTKLWAGIVPYILMKKTYADIVKNWGWYNSPLGLLIEMTGKDYLKRCRSGFYWGFIWCDDNRDRDRDDEDEGEP